MLKKKKKRFPLFLCTEMKSLQVNQSKVLVTYMSTREDAKEL